jgi:ABC-type dipeptide/oligopeptide/nickel transport system permease component
MTRGTVIYAAQRLFLVMFTALIVSSVVFIGVHQLPGNAFMTEHKSNAYAETELLHHYGLDKPWPQQYAVWLAGVAHGDFGESLVNRGVKITPLLIREAGTSISLGAWAMLFTVTLGMTLGVVAAVKQNTWVDYVCSIFGVIGYSLPSFVTAMFLLLLTVSGFYAWTGGMFFEDIGWGKLEQVPVPAISLGLLPSAIIFRLTRASMLEVIRQDYVRTAWAKGLRSRLVIVRHALRNALIPVVTILGPVATSVITGSVVIEYLFGVPGLGKEFVNSILDRDYNIVVGVFTCYAILVGLANLIVDLVYPFLDPRIRY